MSVPGPRPWGLILLSVALSASAQLLFKYGMSRSSMSAASAGGPLTARFLMAVALNPGVVLGLVCYAVSAVLWLVVLSRIDLSQAYPFVGGGFLITMFGGVLLFGEVLSAPRLFGTALVVAGIIFVARS
jgi:multidrug transporter EmrE-like cation transporter